MYKQVEPWLLYEESWWCKFGRFSVVQPAQQYRETTTSAASHPALDKSTEQTT